MKLSSDLKQAGAVTLSSSLLLYCLHSVCLTGKSEKRHKKPRKRGGKGIAFPAPAGLEPTGSTILMIPGPLHLISCLLNQNAQQRWELFTCTEGASEILKIFPPRNGPSLWQLDSNNLDPNPCTQVTLVAGKGVLPVLSFENKWQGRINVLKSARQRDQTWFLSYFSFGTNS